jgi:hypothetical protein
MQSPAPRLYALRMHESTNSNSNSPNAKQCANPESKRLPVVNVTMNKIAAARVEVSSSTCGST